MTQEKFNNAIAEQILRCESLLVTKGEEYAPNADRLEAFKQAAGLQECTPAAAAYGMLAKHLVSLACMVREPNGHARNKWNEKITDSINYLLILRAIIEEEKGIEDY